MSYRNPFENNDLSNIKENENKLKLIIRLIKKNLLLVWKYISTIDDRIDIGTAQGQLAFWDATLEKWTYLEITEIFWDDTNKCLGIGEDTPTAFLHLKAGTASIPSLILEDGTLLSTPQAGAIEFADNKFYLTNVGTQKAIDRTSDVITSTTTVANTTTETTIYTASIAANAVKVGNVQKFKACGLMSTANASDTCTLRIKAGGNTVATITSPGKNLSDAYWEINACTTIRTIGASGTCATKITMEADENESTYCSGNVSIDTTSALDITITAEWSNANAGNTISIGQGWLEYKN